VYATGDTATEQHEAFAVRLSGATGGAVADGIGIGTILTDDVTVSVEDGAVVEGEIGFRFLDDFVSQGYGGLNGPRGVVFGPDGFLYVASGNSDQVLRFDAQTGAFVDVAFASGESGVMFDLPWALAFGPDDRLYVGGRRSNNVIRYDPATGEVTEFIQSGGNVYCPAGLAFGPDGNLYVSNSDLGAADPSTLQDQVVRFQGPAGGSPGQFLDVFVPRGDNGLDNPNGITFNGTSLYVCNSRGNSVHRYDRTTGAFQGVFVSPNTGGLATPNHLEFRPDGHLYVNSQSTAQVLRYSGTTGAFVDALMSSGSGGLSGPGGFAFDAAGLLYVSSAVTSQVLRYGPASQAVLKVQLSSPSATTVAVNYTTTDGTATAGSDYTAASGTVTFAPGQTVKTVVVPTLDDAAAEANETFTVTLSNSVGATITDGTGVGTILDDDSPVVPPSNLVSWWTGDEYGTDHVGPNGGTLTAGVAIAPGKVGNGFSFTGSNYVAANSSSLPTGNSNRTMEMWVKVNAFGSGESFFAGYGAFGNSTQTYHLGTTGDDRLFFSQWGQAVVGPVLQAGVWYHIAVSNVGDSATLYLNGTAVASGSLPIATPSSSQFYIGRIPGSLGDARQLNGMVDEVSVYSRAVTATEIQAIYAAGSNGKVKSDGAKFYVADDGSVNRTYEYAASGSAIQNYSVASGNTMPRGIATTAIGSTVWVLDANKTVYVYNTSGVLQGSWIAGSMTSNATPEGITTNGTDVWIVDSRSDKVFKYTGAATRLSGSQNAASNFNFNLNTGNRDPKDLVTDGTSIWVVNDSSTDKVFKYTLSGALLGSWTISGGGGSPTGITLDPSGASQSLWIVDNGTDTVYEYANARSRTAGGQAAAATFALAAGNTNPQGIADPPAPAGVVENGPRVGSTSIAAFWPTMNAAGDFSRGIEFDPGIGSANQQSVRIEADSDGSTDVLPANPTAAAGLDSAEPFGVPAGELGWAVALDPSGLVRLAGGYSGVVDFDPDPLDTYSLTDLTTSRHLFLVKARQN
ncbi:MAG TPA: LamG-like jellyroll fold domain-containing protein, partial [Gemmataceae bacterium]|nr:LamG-like jellyroll fold domain-containing protein [Gemmataceae bacterium]